MGEKITKQKVVHSATMLFYQKSYHGTSIREIAAHASVNVSLISYYFKSKQGLYEHIITTYFELYIKELKYSLEKTEGLNTKEKLKKLIIDILKYKQRYFYMTCSIQRELSLKSVFVKELTVTYLAKENFLLGNLFFELLKEHNIQHADKHLLLMNLKGMLITPYVIHNEWKHHVIGDTANELFIQRYVQTVYQWLDFIVMKTELTSSS